MSTAWAHPHMMTTNEVWKMARLDNGGAAAAAPTVLDLTPNSHTTTTRPLLLLDSPLPSPHQPARINQLITPFLTLLRWGGLYFVPPLKSTSAANNRHHRRPGLLKTIFAIRYWNSKEYLSLVLCYLSMTVAFVDDLRLVYAFWKMWSGGQLSTLAFVVDNLVTIIWALQCLMVHCILLVMCLQGRFCTLFAVWDDIRLHYPDSVVMEKKFDFSRRFRRKQRCLLGVGIVALIVNCYCLVGPLLIPIEVYEEFAVYIMAPFAPDNMLIKTLITVAFFFRSVDYVFSATLFLLVSDAIVLQFTQFYHDLAAQISKDGALLNSSRLEWHRIKHTKLCRLVQKVDNIFSPYVLIGLASGMFGILAQVFVIYDFLKRGEMSVVTVMSYVYFSLLNLVQVLVILWSGSKVNVAALLPLAKLYEIDQRTLSLAQTQHLTVFLQKLAGHQTGYTALGIFTIDMTTILSLAGFYFTYQILLFQMRNDSSLDAQLAAVRLPPDIIAGLRQFLNVTL